jgi:hypothetical protein
LRSLLLQLPCHEQEKTLSALPANAKPIIVKSLLACQRSKGLLIFTTFLYHTRAMATLLSEISSASPPLRPPHRDPGGRHSIPCTGPLISRRARCGQLISPDGVAGSASTLTFRLCAQSIGRMRPGADRQVVGFILHLCILQEPIRAKLYALMPRPPIFVSLALVSTKKRAGCQRLPKGRSHPASA